MRAWCGILVAFGCWPLAAAQASGGDPVSVTTAHPRLLLSPQRLRLLRRERERNSIRWERFRALVTGAAPLSEPGFALALYYQVAGDANAGRQAIAFALGRDADLRQQALVYDWCQEVLGADRAALTAKISRALAAPPGADLGEARSRALAAIALADDVAETPERELDRLVRDWWRGTIVAGLASGRGAIRRDDVYPLFEFLHAVRDSTIRDLREDAPGWFHDLPLEHMASNYPAPYQAPDGLYFLGATRQSGAPDVRQAALSRAAALAIVAYDVNSVPTQMLQGWLMQDRAILASPFGAPYEFLWANPYLPGLSYDRAPLVAHSPDSGRLFIRSDWEDSAQWFGWFDGAAQFYQDGLRAPGRAPLHIGASEICFADSAAKCAAEVGKGGALFMVGLAPRRSYEVEVEGRKPAEKQSDNGGILEIEVPLSRSVAVRVKDKAR